MNLGPAPPLPPFLLSQLPFRRASALLSQGPDRGRRLHLVDHGPPGGPAILLQHGNPTWSFLWRRIIPHLEGYRVLAPDLLGFGLSDSLPGVSSHTLKRHAESLVQLVEALEPPSLTLVGQDWGGPLVALVGARLPHRAAGLVLANTSVLLPRHPRGTLFHRFSRLPGLSDLAFRAFGFPQNCLRWVQGDRRSIRGEVARAYRWPLKGWRRRAGPLALARMVPDGPEHPSVPLLRRAEGWARSFPGPVALVWGERDPILGRALRRHREAFPRARVIRTQAGHFLQEEVPEILGEAIRRVAAAATSP